LEKELIELRNENNIAFNIEYTGASEELIKVLHNRKRSFGYISLPVYLMNLDKGFTKLNRQNYLTKRYEGRGIGLPKSSDWDTPLNEYFASKEFKRDIESIIARYVNLDLYHFIETFNPENEVSLLNKEKDIQQIQLKVQELEIRDKNQKQIYLIIIISVVSVFLIVIAILFRRLRQNLLQLKEQKAEIEAQSDEIQSINENLELIIKERTRELENKNKALKEYAFITAHKLRSPLASILGLVALMDKIKLPEEDKILMSHLNQSAKKLDDIVHTVMDAIEKSDVA
jgi:signal transduction histidine kinase